LAFALGTLSIVRRNGLRVRSLPVFLVSLLLFVLWLAATMLWTLDVAASRTYVVTMIQLAAMSWLVWQHCQDDRRRRALLQAYVLGCLVSVGNTTLQFLSGNIIDGSAQARFAASGFNANYLATTLALAIPMAWYLFGAARGRFVMWLNILAIPACLLGIVFTGSRGGAICAAAGLLLVPLTYSRLRPVAQGVIVLAVILIASLTYVVAPAFEQRMPSGLQRFTEISSQVRTGDLTGRGRIWLA